MTRLNKGLGMSAAALLMAAIGAAWAQEGLTNDPDAQRVNVTADTPKDAPQILFFRDQGNSPETAPAAHVLLIHDQPPVVSATESTTTVAQSTPTRTEPAPVVPVTSAPPDSATMSAAPVDTAPNNSATDSMPAPRADRN